MMMDMGACSPEGGLAYMYQKTDRFQCMANTLSTVIFARVESLYLEHSHHHALPAGYDTLLQPATKGNTLMLHPACWAATP